MDQVCEIDCADLQCAFGMGLCSSLIYEDCKIGWGPDNGQCFQCESPFVQYFGTCLETCPRGLVANSWSLCVSTTDTSTLSAPDTMQVQEDITAQSYNTGDLYYNIMDALAAAWAKYTVINLIGATVTLEPKYMYSHLDNVEYSRHSLFPDVISDGTWEYLRIQSSPCSKSPGKDCADTTLQIYPAAIGKLERKTLVFQDVIITTRQLFAYSSFGYCPAITPQQGGYVNDRMEEIYEIRSDYFQCTNYADTSLFQIGSHSEIRLQDVTIQDLTIQLKALIELDGGSATLTNVVFSNVQPGLSTANQAVVLGTSKCDPFSTCGSFTYKQGKVEYLNNGYELTSGLRLNPFIRVSYLGNVLIEDVVFQYNAIISSSDDFGLITVGSFQSFTMTRCTVDSSILISRLLDLRPAVLLRPDQQSGPLWFSSPHISITQVSVKRTVAANKLIYISMSQSLLNIVVSDCVFSDLGVIDEDIVWIEFTGTMTEEMGIGGVNTETDTLIYPNYITFARISFTKLATYKHVIYLDQLTNIRLHDLTFQDNGQKAGNSLAAVASYYVARTDTYAEALSDTSGAICLGMIYISDSYNSEVKNLTVQANLCETGGTNLAYESSSGVHSVSNFTLTNNKAGGDQAIGLYLVTMVTVAVNDLQAKSNTGMVRGVIYLNIATSLSLANSLLQDNTAYSGAGIYASGALNLTVTNTVFRNNRAPLSVGGAIFFTPLFSPAGVFALRGCTFESNLANSAGAIAISLFTGGQALDFSATNSRFAYNHATTAGSSLEVSPTVMFKDGSSVQSCTFSHETSALGVISLTHLAGLLVITDSTFEDCSGSTIAVLNLQTGNKAITFLSSVTVQGAKGGPAIRKSNSLLFSVLLSKDCSFLYNSVIAMYFESGYWEDTGSRFRWNTDTAVLMKTSAIAKLTNTLFESNISPDNGGACRFSESTLNCTGCVFRNNTALYGGGLAYQQSSPVTLLDCLFEANKATDFAAAIATQDTEQTPTYIANSIFRRNESPNGLLIMFSAHMYLDSVLVEFNVASAGSPSITAMQSELVANNLTCRHQTGEDTAFLSIESDSTVTLSNSQFYQGSSKSAGAVLLSSSTLTVTKSVFYALRGSNSAVILAQGVNAIELDYVTAYDLYSESEGSVISATYSFISISHSTFRDFEKGALAGISLLYLSITDTTFERGRSGQAGGLLCRLCTFITIRSCAFQNLNATVGGALELETCSSVSLSNTLFAANEARQGGAVQALDSQLSISACNFSGNRANETSGGGLYLGCLSLKCNYSLSSSVFQDNWANVSGGALAWTGTQPVLTNVTSANNQAYYGPNYASFPTRLEMQSSRLLQGLELPPGQPAGVTLSATLTDHYNQKVLTDSSSSANLEAVGASASVSGTSKATAVKGVVTFSDFTIYAEPQGNVSLKIVSNVIMDSPDSNSSSNSISLSVRMRNCLPGESTASHSCNLCGSRTYGFDPAKPCQNCPSNAQCLGTTQMYPDSGYWRAGLYVEKVWVCPRPSSCLGGDPFDNHSISWTGYCANGYTNNMCESCAWGYARSGRDQCGKCPGLDVNIVRIIFVIIAMVAYNAYQVWAALANATKPTAIHSIYLKILTNYLQLVFLVTEFRLNWPEPITGLFSAQENTGGVTEQLYSIDCFLSGNEDASKVYFQKMVFLTVLPACIAICIVFFWAIVTAKTGKLQYMRRELAASLVIAFFFIHPTLTKALFSMFSCTEINNGEYWLTIDLAIPCYDSEHYLYLFAVAIPAVVVWVFAVPLLCLLILIRNRRNLDELWLRLQYGFLISGYARKWYYWEFVITFRKIAVICCSVFFTNSRAVQALTVQVILCAFLLLQLITGPYTLPELNSTEFQAILVANVTIYCGLYYLTDTLSTGSSWFFFVVIVVVNAAFLIYWVFGFLGFIVDKLALAVPWLGINFRPQAFERDPYIEAFLTEMPANKPAYEDFEKVRSLNSLFAYVLQSKFATPTIHGIDQPSYIPSKPFVDPESGNDI